MSLSNRVALFATITFAVLATSFGTPGFARDLTIATNVPAALPVLAPVTISDPELSLPASASLADAQPGDTVAFGTLAAAVAAQPAAETMSEDLACMAGAIYFESKGEPLSGQLAVAEVILNRSKSGRFPASVCSVVTQPGQFSFIRDGRIPAVAPNRAYQTAVAVARVALGDMWDSPVASAMYFHARRIAPHAGRTAVAAIGNHIFYR